MMKKLVLLTLIAVAFFAVQANAAVVTTSTTAPIVTKDDEANLAPQTGTLKWFADKEAEAGQTFTPGEDLQLKSFTIRLGQKNDNDGADEWLNFRLGTITRPGGVFTFTDIYSEEAHWTMDWFAGDYVTFTLDAPQTLTGGVEYGVIIDAQNMGAWTNGIPYLSETGNVYSGGHSIGRGNPRNNDLAFHADLVNPLQPQPIYPMEEADVPAGDLDLIWQNIDPNDGSTVSVDVFFGTDPCALDPVLEGVQDVNSVTVSAPTGATYYWQVNTYIGQATEAIEGPLFVFYVTDSDSDGFPDEYELAHTDPCSPTALNREDDLDLDGLTNWDEYGIGTNPTIFDTDGDTLGDGEEIAGTAGSRPATDPLNEDTDGDGFTDGVETNTGTFVDATDTGTNPADPDTDGDGLQDGVETGTGIFVDATDTGTDPFVADTDADGAEDWYEVAASYTDPTNAAEMPNVPYPLPAADDTPPATNKPVKVFILAGQSNMVGYGTVTGTGPGTLNTMVNTENKFTNLIDETGAWISRNDVRYRGVITCIGNSQLGPNSSGSRFGPEYGFGQIMGYHYDEPVLLIKSSQGNRSISWDYAPPSTPRFDWTDGYTYAGYGECPNRWVTGTGPSEFVWYCGKQWDDCFMDEADWSPTAALQGHGPVENVVDVLDNFATEYPQWATQGFEIAGYVWWQGHKDGGEQGTGTAGVHAIRYEFNMTNFINDIRDYYENRYPNNCKKDAPFVLATVAFGGGNWEEGSSAATIHAGQMAVGDPVKHPEFAGNVASVDATGYWRDGSVSPSSTGYHYNHNAETYLLVGDALGRAMLSMDAAFSIDAGNDMVTWSGEPVVMDPNVAGVTAQSYTWTAVSSDPNNTTIDISDPAALAPAVTITKTAGEMATVTLTLTVDDGVNAPVSSSMTIEVYDDACQAGLAIGLGDDHPTDIVGDDCITNLEDLAALAAKWLDGAGLDAPIHKPEE